MLKAKLAFGAAFVMIGSTIANAATVSQISGSAFVSKAGSGYQAGAVGKSVVAGDRVMAAKESSATVKYPDGCDVVVEAGKVHVVGKTSPCAGGAQQSASAAAGSGVPTAAIIGGGVVVGGLAVLVGSGGKTKKSP